MPVSKVIVLNLRKVSALPKVRNIVNLDCPLFTFIK